MPKHPTYNGQSRMVVPAGNYQGRLISIDEVDKKFVQPGGEQTQWAWKFAIEADDQSATVCMYTGMSYGNDKAQLTAVLTSLYGRVLTERDLAKIDLDDLVGEPFALKIMVQQKQDGSGTYNKVKAIKRVQAQMSAPQRPVSPPPVAPIAVKTQATAGDDEEEIEDWGTWGSF